MTDRSTRESLFRYRSVIDSRNAEPIEQWSPSASYVIDTEFVFVPGRGWMWARYQTLGLTGHKGWGIGGGDEWPTEVNPTHYIPKSTMADTAVKEAL